LAFGAACPLAEREGYLLLIILLSARKKRRLNDVLMLTKCHPEAQASKEDWPTACALGEHLCCFNVTEVSFKDHLTPKILMEVPPHVNLGAVGS